MPINHHIAGYEIEPVTVTWSRDDAMLYALALGCGTDDLKFTTEGVGGVPQAVLPTFAVTVFDVAIRVLPALGPYDPTALFHGEQSITLHRSLPVAGEARIHGGIAYVQDKGSGALIGIWTKALDAGDGSPLFDLMMNVFLAGEGGWGGDRGPRSNADQWPEGAPDHVIDCPTWRNQPLLYRLTGDRYPLHYDPEFAVASGFDRPILHGLCTLGIASRQVLRLLCDDDPDRLQHIEARFAAPVMPGETLSCEIWREQPGHARFEVSVGDRTVIKRGFAKYRALA